jgi:hypothetical protein
MNVSCETATLGHRFLNRGMRNKHNRYAGDFNCSRERGIHRHARNLALESDLRNDFVKTVRHLDLSKRVHVGTCMHCDAYDCDCLENDFQQRQNYRSSGYEHDADYGCRDFDYDDERDADYGSHDDFADDGDDEEPEDEDDRRFDYIRYSYRNWY